ncbi:MAG TPA: T9SS type A sorting domain-containing protein [Flavisolibacter sp.]
MKKICTHAVVALLAMNTFSVSAQNVSECLILPSPSCNIVNPEGTFQWQNGFMPTGGLVYASATGDFRDVNINGLANISSTLTSPAYSQAANYSRSVSASFLLNFGDRILPNYIRLDIINAETGAVIASCTQTGNGQPLSSGNRVCFSIRDEDILPQLQLRYRFVLNYTRTSWGPASEAFLVMDDFGTGAPAPMTVPLSVTFNHLSAVLMGGVPVLTWDVESEVNVKHYQVERSTGGGEWKVVGSVPGAGRIQYQFRDASSGEGTFLYRIRSVDMDGVFKFSTVITVRVQQAVQMAAYPLPATDKVTIIHREAAHGALFIVCSLDGRPVQKITGVKGTSQTTLPVQQLPAGMYLVQFYNGDTMETIKIVRQ